MSTVKWLHSGMQGAPSMANNSFGSMIGVLDACLVDGFNLKTADSLVRTGSVVRFNIAAGHGFVQNQIVTIEGATPIDYNGQFRVTNASSAWFEYEIATTPGPASGTITAKTSPLGFEKPFSGTHKGVYRSPNVLSNRPYLRVDNGTHAGWVSGRQIQGKVHVGLNMTDVDTFVGDYAPYSASATSFPDWGWYKWHQSHNSGNGQTSANNASGATWVMVGDNRAFYFIVYCAGSFSNGRLYGFGDFESWKPNDPFNVFLWATNNYNEGNNSSDVMAARLGPSGGSYNLAASMNGGEFVFKSFSGIGNAVSAVKASFSPAYDTANALRSGWGTGVNFPNGADQSLLLWPSFVWEQQASVRGTFPGIFFVGNNIGAELSSLTIIDNVVGYAGRRFLAVAVGDYSSSNASNSRVAFDITGPWR